jgi:hypothetical protein
MAAPEYRELPLTLSSLLTRCHERGPPTDAVVQEVGASLGCSTSLHKGFFQRIFKTLKVNLNLQS